MPTTLPPAPAKLVTGTTYFVARKRDIVATIFDPTGTANGYYRRRRNGAMFYRPNGEPFAFLVCNEPHKRYFVNARRMENGRVWYSHATDRLTDMALGIGHLAYGLADREVAAIAERLGFPAEYGASVA